MVTGVVPSSPRFLPSIFVMHRVQQSHCSLMFHRVLLTRALALSASQFVHKKKSRRIYTSMHTAGLELTKLTYTRLEDNLIRHRGDRLGGVVERVASSFYFFHQNHRGVFSFPASSLSEDSQKQKQKKWCTYESFHGSPPNFS